MILLSFVNLLLSSLTITGQVIVVGGVVLFIFKRDNFLLDLVREHALGFSFIVALIAALGSLFYSEIAGFEPCKLCWFQRIFMYPQVILFGMAIYLKDKNILNYSIALSLIGAVIAGYHYLLQIGAAPPVACPIVGFSVDCVQTFAMQFGYITIPMMALTAFLLIIFFSIVQKLSSTATA